ncbi:MAG: hypothetical protein ABFD89_17435 [Bryobacteraceae bacterium]
MKRLFTISLPRRVKIRNLWMPDVNASEAVRNPVAGELLALAEVQRMQRANDEWTAEHYPALYLRGQNDG